MMHVDAAGAAYPCYVFELAGAARVPPSLPLDEQWRAVRQARRGLSSNAACVGEAAARAEESVA